MLRYEILYNRSFSSSTNTNLDSVVDAVVAVDVSDDKIFVSQQDIKISNDYYSYESQTGIGIVNDINIKSYLNDPENESLAIEFISYLTGATTIDEFRDIFYDNKKLAEFFNDYYRKTQNYTNQGLSDRKVDQSIDLIKTKSDLTQRDRLYIKTNANTNYIAEEITSNGMVAKKTPKPPLPTDFFNFTGKNESYYINIPIRAKKTDFSNDDFREYFLDCCDGTITYNKYVYYNNFNVNYKYGNFEALVNQQNYTNLNPGPDSGGIEYLKSLLPANFLDKDGNVKSDPSTSYGFSFPQSNPAPLPGQVYDPTIQAPTIIIPQNNSNNSLKNFNSFDEFKTFFNFNYQAWTPDLKLTDYKNKKYTYQQIIDLVGQTNSLFTLVTQQQTGSLGSMSNTQTTSWVGPPGVVKCVFAFKPIPEPFAIDYLGPEHNSLLTNQYKIKILNLDKTKAHNVIIQYENFSNAMMGPEDGFNYVSFDSSLVSDPFQTQVSIPFQINQSETEISINIYKDMPVKMPIVFSLRPGSNPNQICQYIIIYLEEFFSLDTFSFMDEIMVSDSTRCKLMYNCFVDQNFNDNFLEMQRPDDMKIRFINTTGFTLQQGFSQVDINDINQKLLGVYNDESLTFSEISSIARVPQSGIYNIYVYGSYFFGTDNALSDIDLVIVADGQEEARQTKRKDINIAIYNPTGFQRELENFVEKILNGNELSDRVFTVFNSSEPKFKISERIKFVSTAEKSLIKTKAEIFKNEIWIKTEDAFRRNDVTLYQKRLWSIFRNLDFAAQYIKSGKIDDFGVAKTYLNDIKSNNFNTWGKVVTYFYPKIQKLYSNLILL